MPKLVYHQGEASGVLPFDAPILLSRALAGLPTAAAQPCGGKGTCGKCKVRAYGALSPLSSEEKHLLSIEEQLSNVRLACRATAMGDCRVEFAPPPAPAILTAATQAPHAVSVEPSLFGKLGCALIADIGTTTVAAYLLPLCGADAREQPIAASGLNAQSPYGADVISRIEQCGEHGIRPLQDAILNQLDGLFRTLLAQARLPMRAARGVVLTGNTTMLHLAAGLDPSGIAAAPFVADSLFGILYDARFLFHAVLPGTPVYFAPCIDAYLGGDLVCALLACELHPNELLVDVGTNGEMALMTAEGELLCCSTAAGPAFEGAGLRCGMLAAEGAICTVTVEHGTLQYETIGGGKALGICGTGALCALAALLDLGEMDETGLLDERYSGVFPIGDSGVTLTQEDIRGLQLAKAAIAAGIDTLAQAAELEPAQIHSLWLAGGFGSALPIGAAARIGLFPQALAGCAVSVGNAAGRGACLCAASEAEIRRAEEIVSAARVVMLSGDAFFATRFVEQLLFPPLQGVSGFPQP